MTVLPPSSRGRFQIRLSGFDVFWAALAPLLALYLRDTSIFSAHRAEATLLYCSISFVFTIIAFLSFRVSDGISRFFSVYDVISVVKAAAAAGLTTSLVLFTFTRLDGIARSIPILQVLILGAGLLATRVVMTLWNKDDQEAEHSEHSDVVEHIIMIGSSRLTSLYIKMLRAYSPAGRQVIAVLDDNQKLLGRAMCGVPVVGSAVQLNSIIAEFGVHGVRVDRIIIGGDEDLLSAAALTHIRHICEQHEIALDFVPRLLGLDFLPSIQHNISPALIETWDLLTPRLSNYFRYKRLIDFIGAFLIIVLLSPTLLVASILILFDVGSPVVFWQKRIGRNGRSFLLYKFRTLQAPFDRHGGVTANGHYISWIGRLLRRTRIDELPQLFNVLAGEMSLIGPRPLLPQDQPINRNSRLAVRPGITGWAQINGGNLVTREEKGALDDWYIHNASFRLDLRIVLMTLRFLFIGEHRSELAVSEANALQTAKPPQQASSHAKKLPVKHSEPREITAARGQPFARLPTSTSVSVESPPAFENACADIRHLRRRLVRRSIAG